MIDVLFARFPRYRRWARGTWYFVRERLDPWVYFGWVRRPDPWEDILDVETHHG